MDAVMAERVNKLAHSLKELHLAATTEEAFKRAQEILLKNSAPSEEKTLNELMGAKEPANNVEEIIIESKSEQGKEEKQQQ